MALNNNNLKQTPIPAVSRQMQIVNADGTPTRSGLLLLQQLESISVFGASGASHSTGLVPDPGATAGTLRFLREDATWAVPAAAPSGGAKDPTTTTGDMVVKAPVQYNDLQIVIQANIVYSAAHPFSSTDVGNTLTITGGPGFVPGTYTMASLVYAANGTPTSNMILSSNAGTLGSTGGLGTTQVLSRLPVGTTGQVLTADSTQPQGVSWTTPAAPPVTSVFGRTGAVVAVAGDYTAAQVTNAVSTLGSYADPAWISSLSWGKITGAPSVGSYQTPWLQNINGAGYTLTNTGNVGIGNTFPAWPDATTTRITELIGSSSAVTTSGVFAIANNSGSSGEIGGFGIANYNISGAEKRIVYLEGALDGAVNSGYLAVFTANAGAVTEKMRVTSAGVVGVGNNGTVAPDATTNRVQIIVGNTTTNITTGVTLASYNSGVAGEIGALIFANYFLGTAEKRLGFIQCVTTGVTNSGNLTFWTMNAGAIAERMRITNTGAVGIGITPPGTYPLMVHEATNQNLVFTVTSSLNAIQSTNDAVTAYVPLNYSASAHYFMQGNVGIGTTSGTHLLELASDSAAKPTTNTWTIASDGRLKRNIQAFTHGLQTLLRFRPISYEYNGEAGMPEGASGVGLIAQEAAEVYAPCIRIARGRIQGQETDVLWTNTSDLAYMMINALKEINSRLRKLEDER